MNQVWVWMSCCIACKIVTDLPARRYSWAGKSWARYERTFRDRQTELGIMQLPEEFGLLPYIQRQSRAGKEGWERHRNVRSLAKSVNGRARAMPRSGALVQYKVYRGRRDGDSEFSWCTLAPIFLLTNALCCSPHFWLYYEGLPHPSCGQMETTAVAENLWPEAEREDINAQRVESTSMKGYATCHQLPNKKPLTKSKAERRIFLLV